jgi:hypothetical protein
LKLRQFEEELRRSHERRHREAGIAWRHLGGARMDWAEVKMGGGRRALRPGSGYLLRCSRLTLRSVVSSAGKFPHDMRIPIRYAAVLKRPHDMCIRSKARCTAVAPQSDTRGRCVSNRKCKVAAWPLAVPFQSAMQRPLPRRPIDLRTDALRLTAQALKIVEQR